MKVRAALALLISFALFLPIAQSAYAHQPVQLLPTDTTADKGPLLVDGTVSFAVRAAFTKGKQVRAFRVGFKEGDSLSLQYLIVDRKPENALKTNQLPTLVLTLPSGKKVRMKLSERTEFFEPYSQTPYLYLGRYSDLAEEGIHTVEIRSLRKSKVMIAVGNREVRGEVVRGEGS